MEMILLAVYRGADAVCTELGALRRVSIEKTGNLGLTIGGANQHGGKRV